MHILREERAQEYDEFVERHFKVNVRRRKSFEWANRDYIKRLNLAANGTKNARHSGNVCPECDLGWLMCILVRRGFSRSVNK